MIFLKIIYHIQAIVWMWFLKLFYRFGGQNLLSESMLLSAKDSP